MTVLDQPQTGPAGRAAWPPAVAALLDDQTVGFLDAHGALVEGGPRPDAPELRPERLAEIHRAMVLGRRFDIEASALVKQGQLAVYPSSYGQEACQIGAVLSLRPTDWLFPTYRDCMALVTRGIDPVDALTLLRGDWHCGYDPVATRTAPQCTPLATQAPHAAGLAMAAKLAGDDTVALLLCGDGATSEGDFHEACNFAAVYQAPAVFLVQNNQYAISVPLSRQTHAASLAHKAIGYGMPGVRVDGNDVLAVLHVVSEAVERARGGGGPTLIEAMTYRIQAHTNADDATRYRDQAEVEYWRQRDPVDRLERYMRASGLLSEKRSAELAEEADRLATAMRATLMEEPAVDPAELFEHVYAAPTPQLREQEAQLAAELAAEHEEEAKS